METKDISSIPIEQIVSQRHKAQEFANLHLYTFKLTKSISSILGFIHIVVIGITALTSSIVNQTKNPTVEIAIFNNVILYISASLLAVIKYLDLDTFSQKHITKRSAYTALLASMDKKILEHETIDTDYYLWVTKSYDDLLISEPEINTIITKMYYYFNVKEKEKVVEANGIVLNLGADISNNELVSTEAEKYEISRYMS